MKGKEINTASKFGILERCQAFEQELLKVKDIVPDKSEDGIPFDLDGFYNNMHEVIIVPRYDIGVGRADYWEARKQLKERIIALAEKYDLRRCGDPIEDYGEHFYFVFSCGQSWIST